MLIMTNVDHIAGEELPYVIERLLAKGAENAHVVQAMTKKGRWEFLIFVDLPEEKLEPVSDFLVSELGTIGLRIFETRHVGFTYQSVRVRLLVGNNGRGQHRFDQSIRVKLIRNRRNEMAAAKAEYEDLRTALCRLEEMGLGVSFATLKGLVERSAAEGKCQVHRDLRVEPRAADETVDDKRVW